MADAIGVIQVGTRAYVFKEAEFHQLVGLLERKADAIQDTGQAREVRKANVDLSEIPDIRDVNIPELNPPVDE
jgi:hypothetical protein